MGGAGWGKDSRHREQEGQIPVGRHKSTELKNSKEASVAGLRQRTRKAEGNEVGATEDHDESLGF